MPCGIEYRYAAKKSLVSEQFGTHRWDFDLRNDCCNHHTHSRNRTARGFCADRSKMFAKQITISCEKCICRAIERRMKQWEWLCKVCKFYQVPFFVVDSVGDLTFGFLFKFEIDTFDYEWQMWKHTHTHTDNWTETEQNRTIQFNSTSPLWWNSFDTCISKFN